MKLLARLVIALVICLIAIPSVATPVEAAGSFSVKGGSISKNTGYMEDEIRIYGSWDETHGRDIHVYYELFNEDEDDWPYEKVRYEEYDEIDERYEFDYDFDVPESCMGKHKILICDDDDPDDDVDTVEFTVCPLIEIVAPSKAKGAAGTTVELRGKGYDEDESEIEIRFYLEDPDDDYDDDDLYVVAWTGDIDVNDYGSWEDVTFEVPPASKGKHWVYAVGDEADDIEGDNIKGVEFEVSPGISVSDKEGYVGDTITVTGSGFEEDETGIKILFDNEAVKSGITADEDGVWEKSFEVPEAAMGTYDVTAEGRNTKKRDIDAVEFEVLPSLVVTPLTGHVGTTLTVSGGGFPANESVTITYDGVTKGSGITSSKGSLSGVTFAAEHTQTTHTTDHSVVVSYDATTVSFTFVMESDPPAKPVLSSPANATRLGVVTKVTPVFQWQTVDDPSGVSYDLQIGTTPAFDQVLISKTGLTDASYGLTGAEGLGYGSYYWRVKAVDGAKNDSGWTTPYSFKSGYVPFWAFIAIVAGLVVLIGALVFLFTRRGAPYE